MKRITEEQFNRLVHTKIYKRKWDAFITWDGLDMYELAETAYEAKQQLLSRINYGNPDIIFKGKAISKPA